MFEQKVKVYDKETNRYFFTKLSLDQMLALHLYSNIHVCTPEIPYQKCANKEFDKFCGYRHCHYFHIILCNKCGTLVLSVGRTFMPEHSSYLDCPFCTPRKPLEFEPRNASIVVIPV